MEKSKIDKRKYEVRNTSERRAILRALGFYGGAVNDVHRMEVKIDFNEAPERG